MSNTDQKLNDYVEAIHERLDTIEEHQEVVKSIYDQLKAHGYDVKAVRKAVTRGRKERATVIEEDESLYHVEAALGLELPNW